MDTQPLAHQIPAACTRLSVGRSTLYELMNAGRLRAIKVGKRTLIPETELQRFVADELEAAQQKGVDVGLLRDGPRNNGHCVLPRRAQGGAFRCRLTPQTPTPAGRRASGLTVRRAMGIERGEG